MSWVTKITVVRNLAHTSSMSCCIVDLRGRLARVRAICTRWPCRRKAGAANVSRSLAAQRPTTAHGPAVGGQRANGAVPLSGPRRTRRCRPPTATGGARPLERRRPTRTMYRWTGSPSPFAQVLRLDVTGPARPRSAPRLRPADGRPWPRARTQHFHRTRSARPRLASVRVSWGAGVAQ